MKGLAMKKEMKAKQLAAQTIRKAVEVYLGPPDNPLPSNVSSTNCHKKLDVMTITNAVVPMVLYLDLAAGSGGTLDLYRLNQAYLLDPDFRNRINESLQDWRPPVDPH